MKYILVVSHFRTEITGYDRPVKFVTIALIFCYESPDCVVTKHLLRAFVLTIRYESQTEKTETSCNIPFIPRVFTSQT
jgi:hypothetical protein